ncbi:MAG: hypothetical protein Q7R54_00570 [bacterium]|nr:hypothetical protein [bacterium]
MILLYALLLYVVLVWIIGRAVIPHLGFIPEKIPAVIPSELQSKIEELDFSSKDNNDFLQKSYAYITQKYTGSRLKTITRFWRAFGDVYKKDPGFLPCTGQNFLLRTLLVKSGRFQEDDIKVKTVPLNFFIHQYLAVRVDGVWVDVDPWSSFLKVPFGQKLSFFA